MIKTFKCRETQKIFNQEFSKKFPTQIQRSASIKLEMLDAAMELKDLRIPAGNMLEALFGDRKGYYSIRVNQKYRICFAFYNGCCFDVELVDYH